jgi:hypothetical protein
MPTFLNNPAHWHLRAEEVRLLASQLEEPEAKQATLKIADEYDRLAVRSAKRLGMTRTSEGWQHKGARERGADVVGNKVPKLFPLPNL